MLETIVEYEDLTYASVECCDVYVWAIVKGYRNHPQDYDQIVVGFADGLGPEDEDEAIKIMKALS